MTTDYKEFQKWCKDTLQYVMAKLGVVLYQVKWGERLPIEDDTLFTIEARHPYQYAKICYSHLAYERWLVDRDEMKEALLHEVFHILVAPLAAAGQERYITSESITNAEEEVVDRLANAFYQLVF